MCIKKVLVVIVFLVMINTVIAVVDKTDVDQAFITWYNELSEQDKVVYDQLTGSPNVKKAIFDYSNYCQFEKTSDMSDIEYNDRLRKCRELINNPELNSGMLLEGIIEYDALRSVDAVFNKVNVSNLGEHQVIEQKYLYSKSLIQSKISRVWGSINLLISLFISLLKVFYYIIETYVF